MQGMVCSVDYLGGMVININAYFAEKSITKSGSFI